jgi:hypothetical protein
LHELRQSRQKSAIIAKVFEIASDRVGALIGENYEGASTIDIVFNALAKTSINEQSYPT